MNPFLDDESSTLAERRRRARLRAWHRGMRECDLLLGPFADHHVPTFTPDQLARFEALLEVSDAELLDWLAERTSTPPVHQHDVMDLLKAYQPPSLLPPD